MFSKLMNSYYYGKSGKGDYRREDLPKNRWQLFWEMLRIRFSGICRINLMTCVAWIPTMIVLVILANADMQKRKNKLHWRPVIMICIFRLNRMKTLSSLIPVQPIPRDILTGSKALYCSI